MLTCTELSARVSCLHVLSTDFETGLMPGSPLFMVSSQLLHALGYHGSTSILKVPASGFAFIQMCTPLLACDSKTLLNSKVFSLC